MATYRTQARVSKEGTVTVRGLPLAAGEKVEGIVRTLASGTRGRPRHPLAGKPVR